VSPVLCVTSTCFSTVISLADGRDNWTANTASSLRPPVGALSPIDFRILVAPVGGVQSYVARDGAVFEADPGLYFVLRQFVLFDHDLASAAFPVRVSAMAGVPIEAKAYAIAV
jgi:hypothetical protein